LGMPTIEYASLMVELQHDAYTSKTRESHIFDVICGYVWGEVEIFWAHHNLDLESYRCVFEL